MEHGRSLEANKISATPEVPHILWKPQVHNCISKSRHLTLSWAR
jgi:hypothetical protein